LPEQGLQAVEVMRRLRIEPFELDVEHVCILFLLERDWWMGRLTYIVTTAFLFATLWLLRPLHLLMIDFFTLRHDELQS